MSINKVLRLYQPLRPAAAFSRTATTTLQARITLHSIQPTVPGPLPFESGRYFSNSVHLRIRSTTMSQGDHKIQNLSYNDLLQAQKDSSVLIIDVREQKEIDETGKLPGSIHIPMGDVANVLTCLSNEEFKNKYGKEKPSKDTKIVLSCRSGRRSAMVQESMLKLGYENSYNFTGGWLEWESNQKA